MIRGILILIFVISALPLHAQPSTDLSPEEMQSVLRIAKTFRLAKPTLDDSKCIEYSIAVYRASVRFNIEPNLLIAIAAQETYFRESLPEGKAGEYGIVQIRKNWINNPKFRSVFSNSKISDLNKPAKAFMYAAWILRDLKNTVKKGTIPYWSYYNAKKFHNRLKYYLAVNRKLVYLNRGELVPRAVQVEVQINGRKNSQSWKPEKLTQERYLAAWKSSGIPEPAPTPLVPVLVNPDLKIEPITTASLGSGISIQKGGWIELALKRLRNEDRKSSSAPKNKTTVVNPLGGKMGQIKVENEYRSKLLRNLQN